MMRCPALAIVLTAASLLAGAEVSAAEISAEDFVAKAAISDMYEIQAGQLAEDQGNSTEVKEFGRHMVEGHTQTTADLRKVLTDNQLAITPPSILDAQHEALLSALRAARGNAFDRLYLRQQNTAHLQALMLMRNYGAAGDNRALKGLARKTVPVVNEHLAMLKRIKE